MSAKQFFDMSVATPMYDMFDSMEGFYDKLYCNVLYLGVTGHPYPKGADYFVKGGVLESVRTDYIQSLDDNLVLMRKHYNEHGIDTYNVTLVLYEYTPGEKFEVIKVWHF